MFNPAKRERQDAVLAELSELGLTLARELHARALAAETAQDADKLALAFQRVSRGVRQTFALDLKLERDRRQADREDDQTGAQTAAEHAAKTAAAARPSIFAYKDSPAGQRRGRIGRALNRLIWDEAENDEQEYEVLSEDLDARLDEMARRDDFLDLPIETLVRQIKADMRLAGDLRLTACEAPAPPAPRALDPRALDDGAAPPNTG